MTIEAGCFDQSHVNRGFRAVTGEARREVFQRDTFCSLTGPGFVMNSIVNLNVLRLSVVLVLVMLGSGCPNPGATSSACPEPQVQAAKRPTAAMSLEDIGAEFRRLRPAPGHFGRTSGPWNDDVDSWGGRMHVLMNELQARLGMQGTSRATVIGIMGDPDEVALPGTELWSYDPPSADAPDASDMLVYHWRGRHDYLSFFVRDNRVIRARWWMAGE